MTLGSRGSRTRCLVVWAGAGLAVLATWRATRAAVAAGRSAVTGHTVAVTPLDLALVDLAATLVLGCAIWMWLVTTVVALDAARGHAALADAQSLLVPSGVRRLVLAACGVVVVSGLAQPALAATTAVHLDRAHQHRSAVVRSPLHGLPLPDRAAVPGPAAPAASAPADRGTPSDRTVVVRPGDSLWAIAARDLPPGSPDAAVVARWHAIYAANRHRIGPDPDLIEPGLRLHLPGKDAS